MRPDLVGASRVFEALGLEVLERGWLSSNSVLFRESSRAPSTVVDTGYVAHAPQTLALLRSRLGGLPSRVVNTHLHSDHCGGNAALQAAGACEVVVPLASKEAVATWDDGRLTYSLTGQQCPRFVASRHVGDGDSLALGPATWEVLSVGGHDPDAVMFWQPDQRLLIAGDALWERGLAIVFPELVGESGFASARAALDRIERLSPSWVIPGHGRPFADVASAVMWSRRRVDEFEREPERHVRHGARALTMFHMLEHRMKGYFELIDWLLNTPIFRLASLGLEESGGALDGLAQRTLDELLAAGHLRVVSVSGRRFVAIA